MIRRFATWADYWVGGRFRDEIIGAEWIVAWTGLILGLLACVLAVISLLR